YKGLRLSAPSRLCDNPSRTPDARRAWQGPRSGRCTPMSWSYRRAFVVLLAAAFLGATALLQTGYAQLKAVKTGIAIGGAVPAPPADAKPAGPGEFVGITLPTDSRYASQIQAALDYIKDEDWVTATQVLQKLLELKEDVMVPVPRRNADGKDDKAMVSVK